MKTISVVVIARLDIIAMSMRLVTLNAVRCTHWLTGCPVSDAGTLHGGGLLDVMTVRWRAADCDPPPVLDRHPPPRSATPAPPSPKA